MKILQVNCVYNTGSTGKIMYCIHTELLNDHHEAVICYGRGAKSNDANVYKTCGELYSKFNNLITRFTGVMYGGCLFSTNKLISLIKKEAPDIVHLHCINGYFVNIYRLITWLKKSAIKTVITLHAEFMHTANCGYAKECEKWTSGCGKCASFKKETKSLFLDNTALSYKKMYKAFDGFDNNKLILASVSPWLMARASRSPILSGKNHTVVLNGLDTTIFYQRTDNSIKKQLNISDRKMVLHVTPSFSLDPNHIKGGWYVVELAKRMPNVTFVIVGSREQYDNLPKNVINVGRVNDQNQLAEYYSAADATILTSKRETFSMVTAESLCCGTPVVGFKAGAPETITIEEYSSFVDYGQLDQLKDALNAMLSSAKSAAISDAAIRKYDKKNMYEGYLSIYNQLLEQL